MENKLVFQRKFGGKMEFETKYDDKKLKIVISPVVASKLCDLGYKIVKIKPKRNIYADDYNCGTVFLFEETPEFLKDFYELTNKIN